MVLVSIEGNIGAGKSALCQLLKENEMHVSPEPVVDWNVKGEDGTEYNVLKYFYENPSMYACMFQTLILRTRVEQSRKLTHGFIERCVHSDKMFGAMQFERGNMNDVQYATYLYQFRQAIRDTPTIHGHIYLRTDVDTCEDRIHSRKRDGENEITKEYLRDLHAQHEKWLFPGGKARPNVLVLDGSVDYVNDEEKKKAFIRKIRTFMLTMAPRDDGSGIPYE